MGYSDRIVTLMFPEMAEPGDTLWVAFRNPMHVPASELRRIRDVPVDGDDQPLDDQAATTALVATLAGMIVGWRVYDATVAGLDDDGQAIPQPLLPLPVTPELVRRMPAAIVRALSQNIKQALAPTTGPGHPYYEDVLLPAESIYEGTWASGNPPDELVDFEIMREMSWSYEELCATPDYVRRYVADLTAARRNAENNRG